MPIEEKSFAAQNFWNRHKSVLNLCHSLECYAISKFNPYLKIVSERDLQNQVAQIRERLEILSITQQVKSLSSPIDALFLALIDIEGSDICTLLSKLVMFIISIKRKNYNCIKYFIMI